MKELNLNNNAFAKSINTSPTVTFNVISGRMTKPSYDLLEKIVFTFDNVNCEWLLRGEGDIFKDKRAGSQIYKHTALNNNLENKEVRQLKNNEKDAEIIFLRRNLEQSMQMNNQLLSVIDSITKKA